MNYTLKLMSSEESKRLPLPQWKQWGPYVSDRQWGTVREDYSPDGDAWNYFTHDMARSRAYRWGEDGIAGWCDLEQKIVFSLAFWNEKDPILKERFFGLTPFEGNHGEDVKECYFYLDGTPTHSYMKMLYKYPQSAFPYDQLVEKNQKRGAHEGEYELIDTGVFDGGRYFDIVVEYAKESPEDTCIRVTVYNRADTPALLHVIPQLFFRNTWSWDEEKGPLPEIRRGVEGSLCAGEMTLYAQSGGELLFTNNETNGEKLFRKPSRTLFVKDAFHRYIIDQEACINPQQVGTKAAVHYKTRIGPHESAEFIFRLSRAGLTSRLDQVASLIELRKKEADAFYQEIQPKGLSPEDLSIQRQALAGLLWSKQFYFYHVEKWLHGDSSFPPPPQSRMGIRNSHWAHLMAKEVISMPDKWEYPWFAAWDLCFQAVALASVDKAFAKQQLFLLLTTKFQHPNGQMPAYEWNFSDLNPPVEAWAVWRVYEMEGKEDFDFLERCFLKLICNFNWWVNKVDKEGNNFFEGGFLGLDNISIIDRSKPLPGGGFFEESDGTGWMALFALLMMRIAIELSERRPQFEGMALLYLEHFVYIAKAMQSTRGRALEMWDREEGFFYDIISYPSGEHKKLKIRSFVGIVPFFSFEFLEEEKIKKLPHFYEKLQFFMKYHRSICDLCIKPIEGGRYFLSLMHQEQVDRLFQKMWDPNEFFSPYGLRSLSKFHEKNPFCFEGHVVAYEPGESDERIKGGNSNWRGPIWMPTNFLVLDALSRLHRMRGDQVAIPTPDGKVPLGKFIELYRGRLIDLFRFEEKKGRPIHGGNPLYQKDPYWKDLLLFYEHYHGDTGRGLGASHQTGWSGLVATLIAEIGG